MKKILLIIGCWLLLFAFWACKSTQESFNKEEYDKGMVLDKRGIDGCTYIIKLENNETLEPINLSDEFKRNKLEVWVKYEYKKNIASICMMGKIVTVIDIRKVATIEEEKN